MCLTCSFTQLYVILIIVCEAILEPDNILLARSRRRHTNTGGLLDKKGITSSITELRMVSIVTKYLFQGLWQCYCWKIFNCMNGISQVLEILLVI